MGFMSRLPNSNDPEGDEPTANDARKYPCVKCGRLCTWYGRDMDGLCHSCQQVLGRTGGGASSDSDFDAD